MAKLEEAWPLWPSDAKPVNVLDVEVGCSAEKLFELLWTPGSAFVVRRPRALSPLYSCRAYSVYELSTPIG